jgi:cytidylate kinase
MAPLSIAIDGPAACGKSSLAKALARRIGLYHLETGGLYRSVALFFLERGGPTDDPHRILDLLPEMDLSIRPDGSSSREIHFFLGDRDVTVDIRSETVGKWASTVATIPAVRTYLLPVQRQFAENDRIVMDGRDIGTVILPDASLKIFLSAPAATRALRRWLQLGGENAPQSLQEIQDDLEERDRQDLARSIAPLTRASDAIDLDNSRMTIDESVDWVIERLPK